LGVSGGVEVVEFGGSGGEFEFQGIDLAVEEVSGGEVDVVFGEQEGGDGVEVVDGMQAGENKMASVVLVPECRVIGRFHVVVSHDLGILG
jgi:hypothetical protein